MSRTKSTLIVLTSLISLVAAQGHLAVLGPDGISVGYSVDAPEIGASKDVSTESSPKDADKVGQPFTPIPPTQTLPTVVMAPTNPSRPLTTPVKKESVATTAPVSSTAPVNIPVPNQPVPNQVFENRPVEAEPAADAANPIGVWFINQNAMKQYISVDWAKDDHEEYGDHPVLQFTDTTVESGQMVFIKGLKNLSPKFFVGISPNHKSAEIGDRRNHDTAVEFSWKSSPGSGWTYYDIDIERGFSSPVWCHGQGQEWKTGQGCTADVLAACPEKYRSRNPITNVYDQCLGTKEADSVNFRAAQCPKVYVNWNDDWNTKTANQSHVLICTIVSTPVTSEIQRADLAEAERKEKAGLPANAVLPRRALPHGHLKTKSFSRHV